MTEPSRTIPSAADVATLRAQPDYEQRIAVQREVRDTCISARDLVAAKVAANDPDLDPEWRVALDEANETVVIIETELAQWGVFSA